MTLLTLSVALLSAVVVAAPPSSAPVPQFVAQDSRLPPALSSDSRAALIARTQRLLTAVELYEGPADGMMSERLAAAIRRFQALSGLTPDGRVSDELIVSLERKKQAMSMLDRLDAARKAQMDAARDTLLSQPETRDLVRRSQTEVADPTRDVSACLAAPDPRCLLDEALESVKAVNRDYFRDWALSEIVDAQTRSGFNTEAFETLGRIKDPRLILSGLRAIARGEALSGQLDKAVQTADRIADNHNRAVALAAIAEVAAGSGAGPRAVEIGLDAVATVGEEAALADRIDLMGTVAVALHRAGDADAAVAVLDRAHAHAAAAPAEKRAAALGRIAKAFADIGDRDQAMAALAAVDDPAHQTAVLIALAGAQADAGQYDLALDTAGHIEELRYRIVTITQIAVAEAKGGARARALEDLRGGLATLAGIDKDYPRAFAKSRIVHAMTTIGALDEAHSVAAGIDHAALRAEVLWFIAAAHRRAGAADAAAGVEAQALTASDEIVGRLQQVWMYGDLAVTLAQSGYGEAAEAALRRAVATAGSIDSPWDRSRAMSKVAASLATLA